MTKSLKTATTEKTTNAVVERAITSSTQHDKVLLEAVATATVFAVEHGRCNPLTRLYEGVSKRDAKAVTDYLVTVSKDLGAFVKLAGGKFELLSTKGKNADKIRAAKSAIVAKGVGGMMDYGLDKAKSKPKDWVFFEAVANVVKHAVRDFQKSGEWTEELPRAKVVTINNTLPKEMRAVIPVEHAA